MTLNQLLLVHVGRGQSMLVGLPLIASWSTKKRPKKPKRGTFGFNSQTYSLEYYNGSDWYAASMNQSD